MPLPKPLIQASRVIHVITTSLSYLVKLVEGVQANGARIDFRIKLRLKVSQTYQTSSKVNSLEFEPER